MVTNSLDFAICARSAPQLFERRLQLRLSRWIQTTWGKRQKLLKLGQGGDFSFAMINRPPRTIDFQIGGDFDPARAALPSADCRGTKPRAIRGEDSLVEVGIFWCASPTPDWCRRRVLFWAW